MRRFGYFLKPVWIFSYQTKYNTKNNCFCINRFSVNRLFSMFSRNVSRAPGIPFSLTSGAWDCPWSSWPSGSIRSLLRLRPTLHRYSAQIHQHWQTTVQRVCSQSAVFILIIVHKTLCYEFWGLCDVCRC